MENHICVSGTMVSKLSFSHEVFGEKFFESKLSVPRQSGTCDIVPIIVSERLIDVTKDYSKDHVRIHGQIRSHNKHNEQTINLILSVFTTDFEIIDADAYDENVVTIDGYICKPPTYRETPFGRQISDVMLAVNRQYSKSDYIPCVAWGRNAVFTSSCDVGTRLYLIGRLQSREYLKKQCDGSCEQRTAYEVSIMKMACAE